MWSFLAGLAGAALLAGVTLAMLDLGTVTMLDQADTFSTQIDHAWEERKLSKETEE